MTASLCASEEELVAHIEGRANSEQTERVLDHLDDCAGCRSLVAELVADEERTKSGAQVGRFLILRCLGAGGMGLVYAAYDPTLDRKVALKLLHKAHEPTQGGLPHEERILREARAMGRVSHPNVVQVYEVGTV